MELYIHLPFCLRKCRYCDFASYAGREAEMSDYVNALIEEARIRSEELHKPSMETVFIGGGTPSLLPPDLMERLLDGLRQVFTFPEGIEFTSEANPGTLTPQWLDVMTSRGMNRLSLGMQACQPSLLSALGRIHTFDQVVDSAALARTRGVRNLSLDLMFGLPGQTMDDWHETLQAALSLHPTHLSCYGLIPEDGTPLKQDLDTGRISLPPVEEERAMYDHAIGLLGQHGFRQYEISNFALPGYECRHNLGYWRQTPYLGLGASASSMLPMTGGDPVYQRVTNPSGLSEYIHMVNAAAWKQREIIPISRDEACFETMMLGLRTTDGVSEDAFAAMHGRTLSSCYGERLTALEKQGLVCHVQGRWALTRRGMDVQNAVLVELMDD